MGAPTKKRMSRRANKPPSRLASEPRRWRPPGEEGDLNKSGRRAKEGVGAAEQKREQKKKKKRRTTTSTPARRRRANLIRIRARLREHPISGRAPRPPSLARDRCPSDQRRRFRRASPPPPSTSTATSPRLVQVAH